MEFDAYAFDNGVYDEMFQAAGAPHPHCRDLHEWLHRLTAEEINGIQEWVTRSFLNEGITFTVYGEGEADERIIPIDCLPRIVSAADWQLIESGLQQRILALNRFLADVYAEGRIVEDGVVPADMVYGCPQYRREMRGVQPAHGTWVAICGTDIVRTTDGFYVLEDNLRVPSGVSYMIANRKAMKSSLRRLYRLCRVREVEDYGRQLLQTLREIAPEGRTDPTVVVLTPGVGNAAFYEHMFLAQELGAELVEGRDLVVRGDVAYMKTTEGLRRIDVVYRRIDDDYLDPLAFRADSVLGVPGLVSAHRAGNVALANVPGTGVADDKSNYALVPDMIRYYLGEEPILANVPTHLCRRSEDLECTLDNLDSLVVKEVGGAGGYGMLVGPHATPAEREAYAERLRADPANFISQPVLALSRAPCVVEGRAEPRHVDLRPYVLRGRETRIVPGAFCRVALRRGSLVVNSSQGGGGKDLWVLSG